MDNFWQCLRQICIASGEVLLLKFQKYSATGNDFIVVDNRDLAVGAENRDLWSWLCNRNRGIGADGVLLVEESQKADFRMRYINADGQEVDMCGNGGRAIGHYAHNALKIPFYDKNKKVYTIEMSNEVYASSIKGRDEVWLRMVEVYDIGKIDLSHFGQFSSGLYLNTGVPHCVFEVSDINTIAVEELGREIRNNPAFEGGCNINFFERRPDNWYSLRTYERGVEGETLSCGTGATALAIMLAETQGYKEKIDIVTKGGALSILLTDDYKEIYLCGKVEKIFSGEMTI